MKNRNTGKLKPAGAAWPIAYKWVAMGTLVVYTAIGSTTITLAQAQTPNQPTTQTPVAGGRRFDIPAGSLDAVLSEFEKASGVRVVVSNDGIRTIASPGVSGIFTAEQALARLLTKTDVAYRFTSPSTALLEFQAVNSSIEVLGRAAPASPKYTQPLRDTPQTITIIPKAVMEEQGATTLRDVLRNVPGLTMAAGEGGVAAGDNLTIRGFSARNDVFVDGVRDISPQARDPFNLEQVEVIKGPQSAFTGRGSTGGSINLINKAPNLNRYFGGSAALGNADLRRFTADINVPLERLGLGERTAFRLNLLSHQSGVAGRDVTENNRWGVAPSLAFGLGTPSRLTLSYYKVKQDNIPDYGIPWVPATNNALLADRDQIAPVPRNTFYGLRNLDRETLNTDQATVRYEYDFSDNLNLRSQFRYGRSTRDSLTTAPRFVGDSSTAITRGVRSWITEDNIWDNQTDLRARVKTGRLDHSIVAGINLTHEGNLRTARTLTGTSTTTLLTPNPNDVYAGGFTISPAVGDVTGNTQAVYLFDTVRFHPKWEAMGGVRFERFDVDGVTATTLAPVRQLTNMASVRGGLVYKPAQQGSVYASFGSSLNPSLEGLSYNTAPTNVAPEKTYNYEVGTKWDVLSERLSLSTALFRVEKTNARTPGATPDEPPIVLQGNQRVHGVEFGITGSLTRQLRVFGAYTLLDSKILSSNLPTEVGRQILNTPRHSYSIWSTYQLKKLNVGGGLRFTDSRYANAINTRSVNSFWTVDATAAYPVAKYLDLRLNMYNLNNAYYFDRVGGGHVIPSATRSVMVSTNFRF